MLSILKMIEDKKVDQHEGSVMFGKVLKELYIDSAIRHGENLDKEHETERIPPVEGRRRTAAIGPGPAGGAHLVELPEDPSRDDLAL